MYGHLLRERKDENEKSMRAVSTVIHGTLKRRKPWCTATCWGKEKTRTRKAWGQWAWSYMGHLKRRKPWCMATPWPYINSLKRESLDVWPWASPFGISWEIQSPHNPFGGKKYRDATISKVEGRKHAAYMGQLRKHAARRGLLTGENQAGKPTEAKGNRIKGEEDELWTCNNH